MQDQPFFIPAVIILLLSVPLVFGLMPPNRGYGFRTTKTISDPQLWYRANRIGGILMLIASVLYLLLCALTLNLPSANQNFDLWLVHLSVFVLPLLLSFVLTKRYIDRA